jgi:hypothetical protein
MMHLHLNQEAGFPAAVVVCVALLCYGCMTTQANVPSTRPASLIAIPSNFLGDWRLIAPPGNSLPPPYADYLVVLTQSTAACTLYKDKGVSRLELAQGATLRLEDHQVVIRFEGLKGQWLELSLGPDDNPPLTSILTANHTGPTVHLPVELKPIVESKK